MNVGKMEVSAETALSFIESRSDPEVVFRRYRECNVFVIDEVSQMHRKVLVNFEHFAMLVKKSDLLFGGIQVVLSEFFFRSCLYARWTSPRAFALMLLAGQRSSSKRDRCARWRGSTARKAKIVTTVS